MGSDDEVEVRLPSEAASAGRARAFVRAVLAAWKVVEEVTESAELIVSELVTNALCLTVPADRRIGLRLVRDFARGVLRVEVSDAGGGRPVVRSPTQDEPCGRGLLLVEALSQGWGAWPHNDCTGKTVWVELKLPPGPAEDGTH